MVTRQIDERQAELESLRQGLRFFSPARRVQTEVQRLDEIVRRANRAMHQRLTLESTHLNSAARRLGSLSPLGVLRRGYALVTRLQDGKIIQNAVEAPAGTELRVRLAEGGLDVRVQQSFLEES